MSNVKIEKLWRNDITGLRALAVLPVILFHAFPDLLPGGFFGVDVFFVISGYLISGIIFRSLLRGDFSYVVFYEKRTKRILPNLILVLLFAAAAGYFLLLPSEYVLLAKQIYSSAAFYQNFHLLKGDGYFADDSAQQPLLHLWSLSIEEQFYIVFPIMCVLLWRFGKGRASFVGAFVGAMVLTSFGSSVLVKDVDFAFYFPLTRFWELGAGIVLAFLEAFGYFYPKKLALEVRNVLSILGFALIVCPVFGYSDALRHPGFITLLPVCGAVLLIASYPDALVNRTLLSFRPMTYVGLVSYSLYLWHWVFLSFLFVCIPASSTKIKLLVLLLSLVVSSLVYFFIENPLRRCRNAKRVSCELVLILIGFFVFAKIINICDGFPERSLIPGIDRYRVTEGWISTRADRKMDVSNVQIPIYGGGDFPRVLFVGDSHVEQYYPRAKALSDAFGVDVGFAMRSGCYVLMDEKFEGVNDECKRLAEALPVLVSDSRLKSVVVGFKWGGLTIDGEGFQKSIEKFLRTVSGRTDLKVYVVLDAPWDEGKTPRQRGSFDPLKKVNRLSDNFNENDFIVDYPEKDKWKRGNAAAMQAFGDAVEYIDPTPYVCPNGKCNLLKWYKDDDHLQPKRVMTDGVWLDRIFEETKARLQKQEGK